MREAETHIKGEQEVSIVEMSCSVSYWRFNVSFVCPSDGVGTHAVVKIELATSAMAEVTAVLGSKSA